MTHTLTLTALFMVLIIPGAQAHGLAGVKHSVQQRVLKIKGELAFSRWIKKVDRGIKADYTTQLQGKPFTRANFARWKQTRGITSARDLLRQQKQATGVKKQIGRTAFTTLLFGVNLAALFKQPDLLWTLPITAMAMNATASNTVKAISSARHNTIAKLVVQGTALPLPEATLKMFKQETNVKYKRHLKEVGEVGKTKQRLERENFRYARVHGALHALIPAQ